MAANPDVESHDHPGAAPSPTPGSALPRPWHTILTHAALPTLTHDEQARFNVVAAMNRFLAQQLLPRVEAAAGQVVEPALKAELGRPAADRHEYRRGLERELTWRIWSRMRRATMEMRQQAGRLAVLRQLPALVDTCRELNAGHDHLRLDPSFVPPRYLHALPAHLMPGGYTGELVADDITAGASYEIGIYATLGGQSGPASDRAGRATVTWLEAHRPGWRPHRILDLGCGMGANTLVLARAFPDAEVVAIDAGAPMLRYGAARARALGVDNVRFIQGDIEQPPYRDKPLLEQCLRDWDGRYNNEAFWSALHDTDLVAAMRQAGFDAGAVRETRADTAAPRPTPDHTKVQEDYGRGGTWYVVTGERQAS